MNRFDAPWGGWLWAISVLATAACLLAAVFASSIWIRILSVLAICLAALFTVRYYTITSDCILVRRLLWSTRLPLHGLQSARIPHQDERHKMTIRIFGNGGWFSFSGWYWSKGLGAYRAFVTDPKRCVILKFPRQTIVLSPESPEDFLRKLSASMDQA
jgi:Bacterial PH domain